MNENERTENQNREMVVAGVANPLDSLQSDVQRSRTIHNFPADPEQALRLEMLAVGQPEGSGRDLVGETIAVKWWHCQTVESMNEKGEIRSWPRVCLITEDHKCYSFGSWGVFDVLKLLVNHLGKGEWNPPRKLRVKQIQTRNGNSMLTLEPAPDK